MTKAGFAILEMCVNGDSGSVYAGRNPGNQIVAISAMRKLAADGLLTLSVYVTKSGRKETSGRITQKGVAARAAWLALQTSVTQITT